MAYLNPSFRTKKAANDAIKAGQRVEAYDVGIGTIPANGTASVEGPSFQPHTWYGMAVIKNGIVTRVR